MAMLYARAYDGTALAGERINVRLPQRYEVRHG
jgi:hypothetical protein